MRDEVVDLLIEEAGSTFGKAHLEVSVVTGILRSAAGECRRIMGQTIPCDVPGRISMVIRRPLGVVAGIAPFNFPLILATKKVALRVGRGQYFRAEAVGGNVAGRAEDRRGFRQSRSAAGST